MNRITVSGVLFFLAIATLFTMSCSRSITSEGKNVTLESKGDVCTITAKNGKWMIQVNANENAIFINSIVPNVVSCAVNVIDDNGGIPQTNYLIIDYVNKKLIKVSQTGEVTITDNIAK